MEEGHVALNFLIGPLQQHVTLFPSHWPTSATSFRWPSHVNFFQTVPGFSRPQRISVKKKENLASPLPLTFSVHIVNVNSGQVIGSLVGHTNSFECVGISSSYGWVATGSMDQKLIIWDTYQSSRCICEHDEGVTSLAWLGSSRYGASGCIDGKLRIWDSLSGDCVREFNGHADVVQSLAITADGNTMVSASSDGSARVFDISMFK